VLFTAAYVAEIVRGGLQGVPQGQTEAAQAIGMSPLKITRLIVLPQALRNVIPALVGQFISLFKDTSLVVIIGLLDLLKVAQDVNAQPDFRGQGLQAETLVFASFVYWAFCYSMSRASQRLEQRLGVGER
jgi:general L-amino acid transport system permease protein